MDIDPLRDDLGFKLATASLGYEEALTRALAEVDPRMTAKRFRLLQALDHSPGASGAELGEMLGTTPQSSHGLVAGTERAGLVKRTRYVGQGSRNFIRLTSEGRDALQRSQAAATRVADRLRSAMPDPATEETLDRIRHEFGTA